MQVNLVTTTKSRSLFGTRAAVCGSPAIGVERRRSSRQWVAVIWQSVNKGFPVRLGSRSGDSGRVQFSAAVFLDAASVRADVNRYTCFPLCDQVRKARCSRPHGDVE